jgi:hypothetical protein
MPLRTVTVTRYVTPLREGGSLPAVVEADDDGLYVLKFRGAGQGAKALIAELVGGELARAAGLPVPEIVFAGLDPELARTEPDAEIQDLIRASGGLNLALDFLPGAVTFDPLAHRVDAAQASDLVWLDAFISNVDRTPRNSNLMWWHGRMWLIDHGAALYFHHDWPSAAARARSPFPAIKDHVLLPAAADLAGADARLCARLTPEVVAAIVDQVPESWLAGEPAFARTAEHRAAYVKQLCTRLAAPRDFVAEALRARAASL